MNHVVFIKMLFICAFLALVMCTNDSAKIEKSLQNNLENDYYHLTEKELEEKIFHDGDTLAYNELFTRKFKSDMEEMLIWSEVLAYRFNSSLGYKDIYGITLQTYLQKGVPFSEMETITQQRLLECLLISAKMGDFGAKQLIIENHPELLEELKDTL